MADFYDAGVEGLLDQSLNWLTDDWRVALLQRGYRFNPAHRTFSDVAAHVNGASDTLEGRGISGRDASAEKTYLLATKPAYSDTMVVYRHSRDPAQARLLLCAPISPVHPVAGQRIDTNWPDGLVFSL